MDTSNDNKNLNRRRAFRIYDQINLLYHKIESINESLDNKSPSSITEHIGCSLSQTETESKKSLPVSYSQENDTLNVNISANGISFTCKEELLVGDHLVI